MIDGRLIIGEAKMSLSQFGDKEIEKLTKIAKNLSADAVVIGYLYEDDTDITAIINKLKEGGLEAIFILPPSRTPQYWP